MSEREPQQSSELSQTRTVRATFEIVGREETADEPADEATPEGPSLSRVTINKRYAGPLEGSGVAQVLLAQGGGSGSGYVASERVVGRLDGRVGTFVVQHAGVARGDDLTASGVIVPGSGTGDLAGIAGRAYEAEMGVLTLELDGPG